MEEHSTNKDAATNGESQQGGEGAADGAARLRASVLSMDESYSDSVLKRVSRADSSLSLDQLRMVTSQSGEFALRFGCHSIQGRRNTQEDSHAMLAKDPKKDAKGPSDAPTKGDSSDDDSEEELPWEFFGVFDGHGGAQASEYTCKELPKILRQLTTLGADMPKALAQAIALVESQFLESAHEHQMLDGTTAAIAVIEDGILHTANVGDSEIVLCRSGKAIALTEIHNMSKNAGEVKRVVAGGGKVYMERLCHPVLNPAFCSIAVTRSIGDVLFKHSAYVHGRPVVLTAEPHIASRPLTSKDDFILLACDGLWDVFSHQEAVDHVLAQLQTHNDPGAAARSVVDSAFERGSTDNITVVVVTLRQTYS